VDDKDIARLNKLVQELAVDPRYATGERRFPRRVTLRDAATIASGLQGEVDAGVAAREAALAARGAVLACKRGCNGCCEEPIMIFRPEAAEVVRWLTLPDNAAVRDAFLAAYLAWKERVGDTPARLSTLFAAGESAPYVAAHVEAWSLGVLCAFNHGGDCTIYPVRPINCRVGHALDTSEHCHGAAPEPATRATFVPLDQFVARTRKLLAAAHHAVGGPRGRVEALCDVVHEMLAARPSR
jgi:Fe-S-cluster containining protein